MTESDPIPFGPIPAGWRSVLGAELEQEYFQKLEAYVAHQRELFTCYPPPEQVFTALEHTPFEQVRVLIIGQDPYQNAGQAQGLAFSVERGQKLPPSLKNIFAELETDLGIPRPSHGSLLDWADRGVLLLNTVLTVRAKISLSHRNKGWETFTDKILEVLAAREDPMVFVLWGKPAQEKLGLIDAQIAAHGRRHLVLSAPHPSPYSAMTGFFGSKPFSKINEALVGWGKAPIDWSISE